MFEIALSVLSFHALASLSLLLIIAATAVVAKKRSPLRTRQSADYPAAA